MLHWPNSKIIAIQLIGLMLLWPFPDANSMTTQSIISLSRQCKACHTDIHNQWRNSIHAKTANDPWVLSMYNGSDVAGMNLGPSYKKSFPKSTGKCATCHAPDYAIEDPLNTNLNKAEDSLGVSCLFCHFAKTIDVHRNGHFPGVQSIRLKSPDRLRKNNNGCLIPKSSLVKSSIICGACHYGKFHDTVVFSSYDEWSKRQSGNKCQECHFIGKNHQLNIDKDFLSKAVDLKVETWSEKEDVFVKAEVTNIGAGHYYPTGHPIRNVLLIIEVNGTKGQPLKLIEGDIIPEYGGVLSPESTSTGYSGKAGKGFARIFEKVNPISCFNSSVPGPNARVGQSLALDEETRQLFPQEFWKRTMVLEDSRLPTHGSYKRTFKFRSNESIPGTTLTARLIYRKAFEPLARYYGWKMDDILVYEISKEVPFVDQKEVP